MKSYAEASKVHWLDDAEALKLVRGFYKLSTPDQFGTPLARACNNDPASNTPANLVLIIMESMSAEKMSHFGNQDQLTPFLDSLSGKSLCFDNFYSAGRHTYNGIFSSLYSYPAILAEHPMSSPAFRDYTGLPVTLKENGYETIFFTTHDPSFDNMGTFLRTHGFNQLISQNDYDSRQIQSAFGVPDHVMFQYAVDTLTQLSQNKKPFFASFMTVSDHAPYHIPAHIPFQARSSAIEKQVVEYADWSLKNFFNLCSGKPWFKNTIFVFVADHGCVMGESKYDIPLSYHHIPFLVYSADTSLIHPRHETAFGGQIDIFPTLMDILHRSFVNNTPGIDLLKEQRPYAFFSSDDRIGCIDDSNFYVYNLNGSSYLYNYRQKDASNKLDQFQGRADTMKNYAFSIMQFSKWMMDHKLTGSVSKTTSK